MSPRELFVKKHVCQTKVFPTKSRQNVKISFQDSISDLQLISILVFLRSKYRVSAEDFFN